MYRQVNDFYFKASLTDVTSNSIMNKTFAIIGNDKLMRVRKPRVKNWCFITSVLGCVTRIDMNIWVGIQFALLRLTPQTASLSYTHWYEYMGRHSVRPNKADPADSLTEVHALIWVYGDRQSACPNEAGSSPGSVDFYIIKTEDLHWTSASSFKIAVTAGVVFSALSGYCWVGYHLE